MSEFGCRSLHSLLTSPAGGRVKLTLRRDQASADRVKPAGMVQAEWCLDRKDISMLVSSRRIDGQKPTFVIHPNDHWTDGDKR